MITPDLLRKIPLFDSLTDALVNKLMIICADVHLGPNQWLIQEGDMPSFFVLVSGEIDVIRTVNGDPSVIASYKAGDFFGEVPLLLGSAAFASLRTKSDCRILRLERPEFQYLITHSEKMASSILQTMMQRVEQMQQFSINTPIERTLVIGQHSDLACFKLRQFLSGNHQEFRWLDLNDNACHPYIPAAALEGPYPAVILPSGEVLKDPGRRELAERLGLQTKPSHAEYDVVIVGGGPAGLAAAVYGASEGLKTLMVERAAPGGQAGTSSRIENYLGFPTGISGGELGLRALDQAKRFGAEILVARATQSLETRDGIHTITLDGDGSITTRTIILATGVFWRKLDIPGADALLGRGIYFGAARTEAMGVAGKDVYLIGGGNSAGQAAMFFADYARKVTLLIRASNIDKGMSQYLIDQLKTRANVCVELNSAVTAVHGESALEAITVANSRTAEEQTYETSSLFVFIGADAQTDWLANAVARDDRGYILTGRDAMDSGRCTTDRSRYFLETSVEGIFAAGDVRHGSVKRVASGVGEGSMAIAFIHQYRAAFEARAEPPPSVSG
ncbi:MAG: FAD-dependent oxidoreductase [Capsulimonas sp.]|uniref:FAD-dependent oxidoreductase n=1 Tax=Capsulimonas sp. TaxID=2494211 RepID=UPI003263FF87